MTIWNKTAKYGAVAKFFHWVLAVLILLMLCLGFYMGTISDKVLKGVIVNLHKCLGLAILALMILRGIWALCNVRPAMPTNTRWWERRLERLVHYSFYVVLLAMPLAGWIGASSAGKPPQYGSLALGLPLAHNGRLIDLAFQTHNFLAGVIIVLISIHIAAAFFHYFFKKDRVVQRMWF